MDHSTYSNQTTILLKKKKKKKSRSLNSQLNVPHITQPFVVTPSKSNFPDYEAFIGNENMKSFFQAGPHNFSRDLTINFKKKHLDYIKKTFSQHYNL